MSERFRLAEYEGVIREVLDSGGQFTLFPRGTSMLPLIVEGRDSVSLERADSYSRGDIAFYKRADGSFVLHRIIAAENGAFTMCGDNQTALERGIKPEQIIARVAKITRRGKTFDVTSLRYRAYCAVWRCFLLRRVYFKLRGRLSKKDGV